MSPSYMDDLWGCLMGQLWEGGLHPGEAYASTRRFIATTDNNVRATRVIMISISIIPSPFSILKFYFPLICLESTICNFWRSKMRVESRVRLILSCKSVILKRIIVMFLFDMLYKSKRIFVQKWCVTVKRISIKF